MNPRRQTSAFYPAALAGLIALPAAAWIVSRGQPSWVVMWALAVAEFAALKIATLLAGEWRAAPLGQRVAYLLLWPGMDARAFMAASPGVAGTVRWSELCWALVKTALGLGVCGWVAWRPSALSPLAAGWVGMIGIVLTLHFGVLHVLSWGWRRAGVQAPRIMRAPAASTSLASFWGGRWNAAFADAARRLLFRPLAGRLGAKGAWMAVFLVSGLLHETVISLPARGGWGGPTAYFLLQAAGIALEKSSLGRGLGLGNGLTGWAWMAVCTVAPLPLLFHSPFVLRVIVPQFQAINHWLL